MDQENKHPSAAPPAGPLRNMTVRIAIIGAGRVGTTLGSAFEAKGHSIVYGVRDPKKSQERNAKTVTDAMAAADIVVLATPWPVTESLVCEHAWSLAGKIVIDATNPISATLIDLAIGFDSSGAELLQSQAREARVFKAFNTVGVDVMAKPRFPEGRAAMFVAGPDGPDKKVVMSLVADVGFDTVDAGPLKAARLLEPDAVDPACSQRAQSEFCFGPRQACRRPGRADPAVEGARGQPRIRR